MTGFARAAGAMPDQSVSWTIEIRSVNSRGLDLKLRLPPLLEPLEPAMRSRVGQALTRGACQIQVSLERMTGTTSLRLNETVLAALYAQLSAAAIRLGAGPVGLEGLVGLRGVIEAEERADVPDEAARWEGSILADFDRALEALVAMRLVEGASLRRVLLERLDRMAALVDAADALPARQPTAIRTKLENLVAALVESAPALDPQRLHQEAVLIATRADIREELDRLRAHLAAARDLMEGGGPVGRKLDFLSQEFARESNTLCAKSNDIALTAIGLELKTLTEQFREQVQNVE